MAAAISCEMPLPAAFDLLHVLQIQLSRQSIGGDDGHEHGARAVIRRDREILEQRQRRLVEHFDQQFHRSAANPLLFVRRPGQIEPEQATGRGAQHAAGLLDHPGLGQAPAHGPGGPSPSVEDQHLIAHLAGRRPGDRHHGDQGDRFALVERRRRMLKYGQVVHGFPYTPIVGRLYTEGPWQKTEFSPVTASRRSMGNSVSREFDMAETIAFTLNGEPVKITTDGQRPLLWVLRTDFGLTGTKFGCGQAQCGACTVLVDNKAVRSCVYPVRNAGGREVRTIEGLVQERRVASAPEGLRRA